MTVDFALIDKLLRLRRIARQRRDLVAVIVLNQRLLAMFA